MSNIVKSAQKIGLKELKRSMKTRDNTMLRDGATMIRAIAYANTAKDGYYHKKRNQNTNNVTVKNVHHLEEETNA